MSITKRRRDKIEDKKSKRRRKSKVKGRIRRHIKNFGTYPKYTVRKALGVFTKNDHLCPEAKPLPQWDALLGTSEMWEKLRLRKRQDEEFFVG